MSTRVLDADGFADVAAKASDRQAVHDYIADQTTLRPAPTSNFWGLGAFPAVEVFEDTSAFLDRNLTDVVILMSEKHSGEAKWRPGTYTLS